MKLIFAIILCLALSGVGVVIGYFGASYLKGGSENAAQSLTMTEFK